MGWMRLRLLWIGGSRCMIHGIVFAPFVGQISVSLPGRTPRPVQWPLTMRCPAGHAVARCDEPRQQPQSAAPRARREGQLKASAWDRLPQGYQRARVRTPLSRALWRTVLLTGLCPPARAGLRRATPDKDGCRPRPQAPETQAFGSCGAGAGGPPGRAADRTWF